MAKLNYPTDTTYFIAWGADVVAYGVTEPDQCTETGQPNFETFTDFDLFTARLLDLGVIYEEENNNETELPDNIGDGSST